MAAFESRCSVLEDDGNKRGRQSDSPIVSALHSSVSNSKVFEHTFAVATNDFWWRGNDGLRVNGL